jgi:hypothetical protein
MRLMRRALDRSLVVGDGVLDVPLCSVSLPSSPCDKGTVLFCHKGTVLFCHNFDCASEMERG